MVNKNINTHLYNYVLKYELTDLEMTEYGIELDENNQTCKLIRNDGTTTLTIFSIPNSMRYVPFVIDTLMGTIISMFGYQSEMHRVMALFVEYVELNHFKK